MHSILQLVAICCCLWTFVLSKPNPPTQFSAVLAVTSSIGENRFQFYYDLVQAAERSEYKTAGLLQITVVKFNQHQAYVWVDGTQQCQVLSISSSSNPNIWSWLDSAQSQGQTTFDGRTCFLWQGRDPDSSATLLGCFASDSTPVFMNVSYPGLRPVRIAFYNLRASSQSPSLFQPPSFCGQVAIPMDTKKKFSTSHFWTDLANRFY